MCTKRVSRLSRDEDPVWPETELASNLVLRTDWSANAGLLICLKAIEISPIKYIWFACNLYMQKYNHSLTRLYYTGWLEPMQCIYKILEFIKYYDYVLNWHISKINNCASTWCCCDCKCCTTYCIFCCWQNCTINNN